MIVKKVDLEENDLSRQRVTIELSYSELSTICNLIAKMEMKHESDYSLKYEFACLHDFCHDRASRPPTSPNTYGPDWQKKQRS